LLIQVHLRKWNRIITKKKLTHRGNELENRYKHFISRYVCSYSALADPDGTNLRGGNPPFEKSLDPPLQSNTPYVLHSHCASRLVWERFRPLLNKVCKIVWVSRYGKSILRLLQYMPTVSQYTLQWKKTNRKHKYPTYKQWIPWWCRGH
jgi:hypothetical protein